MGEEEGAFPRGVGLLEFMAPSADEERRSEEGLAAYAADEVNAGDVFEAEIIEARQSPDIADWHEVIGPIEYGLATGDIPRTRPPWMCGTGGGPRNR